MNQHFYAKLWQIAKALRAGRCRIGFRAAYLVVALGAFLTCIGLASLTVLIHDDAITTQRAEAANPIFSTDADAKLLWKDTLGAIDNKPVDIIAIEPLTADAPLPPGLSQWPGPGQAYVSPQLAPQLTGARAQLYGQVVGVIDATGLDTPAERRVYMRPATDSLQTTAMNPVSGFGLLDQSAFTPGSGYLYKNPLGESAALVIMSLIIAGLLTTSIATSIGSQQLRRSNKMLCSIGFSRYQLWLLDAVEYLPAYLSGTILATLCVIGAMCWDLVLPFLDARYLASDTRQATPAIICALLCGFLLSILTIIFTRTKTRQKLFYRRRHGIAASGLSISLFILALACTFALPQFIPIPSIKQYVAALCGIAAILLCGAPVSLLCKFVGHILNIFSAHHPLPGTMIAGRMLQQLTTRTSTLATGVCALVVVAGLVQLWTGSLTAQEESAKTQSSAYDSTALMLSTSYTDDALTTFFNQLPANISPIIVTSTTDNSTTNEINTTPTNQINASCPVLQQLGFVCPAAGQTPTQAPSSGLALYLLNNYNAPAIINDIDNGYSGTINSIYFISTNGTSLNADQLQTITSRYLPGSAITSPATWLISAADISLNVDWVLFLAAIGGTVILIALAAALANDLRRISFTLSPIGAVAGSRSLTAVAAAWCLAVPILAAGVLGILIYNIMPIGIQNSITDPLIPKIQASPVFSLGAFVIILVAIIFTVALAWRRAYKDVSNWRPGLKP